MAKNMRGRKDMKVTYSRHKTSKYLVMKKLRIKDQRGWEREYYPGDIILCDSSTAHELYWRGIITDDMPKTINGKAYHPEDKRNKK